MAINNIGGVTGNGAAHLACDTAADVTDLQQYAEDNNLKLGSDCLVVATGDVYLMKSDQTWVKQ